jgi:hypothetical protein
MLQLMMCFLHSQTKAVLDWHTKKRLVAKQNNTSQQRAKTMISVGSGNPTALFMHVVVGDLLTLQIPTSAIEINESWEDFLVQADNLFVYQDQYVAYGAPLKKHAGAIAKVSPDIRPIITNRDIIATIPQKYTLDWCLRAITSAPAFPCTSAAA